MTNQDGLLAAIGRYGGALDNLVRHRRWARWTFNGVAIAAVSISLVGRAQTFREAPAPQLPVPPVVAHPQSDARVILAANLFGIDEHGGPLGALSRSALNLVVTGLLVAGEAGGMVVISVDGQAETAFAAGDEILPGVRLQAVEAERIIIARGGRLETVPLKEIEQTGKATLVLASASETSSPVGGAVTTFDGASHSSAASRPMPATTDNLGRGQLAAASIRRRAAAAPVLVAAPVTPRHLEVSQAASGSTTAPVGSDQTVPPPQPGTATDEVPRPKAGAPATEVPRPAPGTSVPEVPRPPAGKPVDGPPRPPR
ncbi:type II secretion system protein N [Chromohalobacter sp.]|uniref:type II secretion system protein N n=1 Tax=Chromohalobacter sp. TaxID=50740 RepID=UPI00258DB7FE|nr:type II secretion system protein N [Chromohalobacter sp.]MCI0509923.1 hypothetical protein [Chromohalobacter sp.]